MMATDAEEIRNQTSPCPIPDNSLSTLSIKITRKNQDRHWKLRFIYLQCCEYRHTSRRSESHTGTGHTSPLRKHRNIKLPRYIDRHLVSHNSILFFLEKRASVLWRGLGAVVYRDTNAREDKHGILGNKYIILC